MADLLRELVEASAPRLAVPPPPLPRSAPRSLVASLAQEGVRIVAEIKHRSPSAGLIREPLEPEALAVAYQRGGAAGVSVVTEERFFGGDPRWVGRAREACQLPVLQKDFFSRPEHLAYGRSCGADAVLLIARILPGGLLAEMLAACQELGLEAVVETHDAEEIEKAVAAGAPIVGVNARDLATFQVDLGRAAALLALVPPAHLALLESGIASREQFGTLLARGVRRFLIGEYLLRHQEPERALRELLGGP